MQRNFNLLIVLVLMVAGCSNSPDKDHIKYFVIAQGTNSNISLTKRFVVKDEPQWRALWRIHSKTPTQLPKIDFDDDMVISIFAGQYPSGGYRLEVKQIIETEDGLQVDLKLYKPTKDNLVSMTLTQPYLFIKTERTDDRVYFNIE